MLKKYIGYTESGRQDLINRQNAQSMNNYNYYKRNAAFVNTIETQTISKDLKQNNSFDCCC